METITDATSWLHARRASSYNGLHSEKPEYEEARKARYSGSVLLAIDVDVNGRAANVRVVKSLGLGLDEKAKAAVPKWRFRPAMAGGSPVTVPAQVQVTFHLL